MRRIALALLASTSLLGLASVAEAADLAVRKAPPPPPPPPLWSWTGFYIGAHVGAGWARNEFTTKDEFCLGDEFDGFGCENRDRGSHNAIGGLGLVTVLRLIQVGREEVERERARPKSEPREEGDEPLG